jgi:hypothetical protein
MKEVGMELLIDATGQCRCVYDELLDLRDLGPLTIERASHVEPNAAGQWIADLSPVSGPQLGPFPNRSEALVAEVVWLRTHWLLSPLPIR